MSISAPAMKLSGLEEVKRTAFTSGLPTTLSVKMRLASACMPLLMVFILPGPLNRTATHREMLKLDYHLLYYSYA